MQVPSMKWGHTGAACKAGLVEQQGVLQGQKWQSCKISSVVDGTRHSRSWLAGCQLAPLACKLCWLSCSSLMALLQCSCMCSSRA